MPDHSTNSSSALRSSHVWVRRVIPIIILFVFGLKVSAQCPDGLSTFSWETSLIGTSTSWNPIVPGTPINETLTGCINNVPMRAVIDDPDNVLETANSGTLGLNGSGFLTMILDGDGLVSSGTTTYNALDKTTLTLSFAEPILVSDWVIMDIDEDGSTPFQDSIFIEAYAEGLPVPVIIDNNGSGTIDIFGSSAVARAGTGSFGPEDLNAQISVDFASEVDSIILEFIAGSAYAAPLQQGIAISGFTSCCSFLDLDGDNVPDIYDLDDDNDGITDAQELCDTDPDFTTSQTINIEINLDQYENETSWVLNDPSGNAIASGSGYSDADEIISQAVVTTVHGFHTFVINDSASDGMVGPSGGSDSDNTAHYSISVGGKPTFNSVGYPNYAGSRSISFYVAPDNIFSCLTTDPSADDDGDGFYNFQDFGYCTLNTSAVCDTLDFDMDGLPNYLDLDSDNDGILDNTESQTTLAYNAPSGEDINQNGLDDIYDPECMSITIAAANASSVFASNSVSSPTRSIGSNNLRAFIDQTTDWLILDLGVVIPAGNDVIVEGRRRNSDHTLSFEESTDGSSFSNLQSHTFIGNAEVEVTFTLVSATRYVRIRMSVDAGLGRIEIDNVRYPAFSQNPCNVSGALIVPIDIDRDGFANYKDGEADGDGCPDAIEGADGFTYDDLTGLLLTGAVDSTGIPIVVGTGQADVSSQDSWTAAAICSPCHPTHPDFSDYDNDLIGDYCDIDDDNDGIPDADECFNPNDQINGLITPDDFIITTSGSNTPVMLDSIVINGTAYGDFILPDAYMYDYSGGPAIDPGDFTIIENGTTQADYTTSADWSSDVLDALQNLNMNHYPNFLAHNLLDGSDYVQMGYFEPIEVNDRVFVAISERTGNNAVIFEALDINQNPIGPQFNVTSTDYTDSGFDIQPGNSNLGFLTFSLDDIAPLGQQVYFIRIYDNTPNNDAADIKVMIFGDLMKSCIDTDGDGVVNSRDLDSDNDAIWDASEAGHGLLVAPSGRIDGADSGSGPNGLFDGLETSAESDTINYNIADSEISPDGIYDPYDLDSDGDGCLDILETFRPNSFGNGTVSNVVDTFGLSTRVPVRTPFYDFWTDPSLSVCDDCYSQELDLIELNVDSDSDGIYNFCDWDDDNDGILDMDESIATVSFSVPRTIVQGDTSTVSRSVGDMILYSNALTDCSGEQFDILITINTISPGAQVHASTDGLDLLGARSDEDDHVTFTITAVESGTSTFATPNGVSVQIDDLTLEGRDIDSVTDADFTEVFGYSNTTTPDSAYVLPFSLLDNGGFINGAGPINFTTFRQIPITGPNDWFDNGGTPSTVYEPGISAFMYFEQFTSVTLVYGLTGSLIDTEDMIRKTRFSAFSDCDNDNDGIPNRLDLDSDNDGIYDMHEAGHNEVDADDDGRIDNADINSGPNGIFDVIETMPESDTLNFVYSDSDGDGNGDYFELDADFDGCYDGEEEDIADSNYDGIAGGLPIVVDTAGRITSITYDVPPNDRWQDEFLNCESPCFLAADNSEILTTVNLNSAIEGFIGNYGLGNVEAIEFDPLTSQLFAARSEDLYVLDTANAFATFIGEFSPLGDADGTLGQGSFDDIDGLARDPINDIWYASARIDESECGLPDVLFIFDPLTANYIPGAFADFNGDGNNDDYVVIQQPSSAPCLNLIDDLGFNPFTGELYGVANGEDDYFGQTVFVTIDPLTGATSGDGNITYDDGSGPVNLEDVEGLTVSLDNEIFITTGARGNPENSMFQLSGVGTPAITATRVQTLNFDDYEGITCMTFNNPASIGEFVYADTDGSGTITGADTGIPGVTVELYNSSNGALLSTTVTNSIGQYTFTGLLPGTYEVHLISSDFNAGEALENHELILDPSGALDSIGITDPLTAGQFDNTMNFLLAEPGCKTATMNPHVMYFRRN